TCPGPNGEWSEPRQLSNVGLDEVNENFVPPPYDRTIWSSDQRFFVYDFKNGDQQEIWMWELDANKQPKRTVKLGPGLDPRWKGEGIVEAVLPNGELVQYRVN